MAYRRRPSRRAHPLSLRTFGDAVAEALALFERFGFAHAVAVLDDHGRVLDLTAFTDRDRHTVDTALDWASCMLTNLLEARRIVLFSVGATGPTEIGEDDVDLFDRLREVYADAGIDLLDWILLDGDHVRSLAFTRDPDGAWPDRTTGPASVHPFPGPSA